MQDTNPYAHKKYLLVKQFMKLFGGTFRIYDEAGSLQFHADMKAFKLKEDITIFADEEKNRPLIQIKARSILDFSAAYDVNDSITGEKLGALKRKGFKSIIKDEWVIMDINDYEIGKIEEDSMVLALLRRFITALIPQKFDGTIRGQNAFQFSQHFNPFILKMDLDFSTDSTGMLDRRLGIAAAVLVAAIEGRQDSD